jgi:spermidine synthase
MPQPRRPHSIEISEEAGVRYLHFGSDWIQGAMRVRRPYALELEYTREMLACLLWRDWHHWPREVLLIGLGAGSLAKFLYHQLPRAKLQIVEIDARIPPFAAANFALPHDPQRIDIRIDDGARFVADSGDHYDLILVDGFDHRAKVGALDSVPFYRACRARLARQGVMATNLFGNRRGFAAALKRVSDGFGGALTALPPGEMGNVIAFGFRDDEIEPTLAELRERARALHDSLGLNLRPLLRRMVATGMLGRAPGVSD